MSQVLFLVRLRVALRVRAGHPCVGRTLPFAIFSKRESAEEYVRTRYPILCNPFARDLEVFSVDLESKKIVFYDYDYWPNQWERSWGDLIEDILKFGVEPPHQSWRQDVWELWWETITAKMSHTERENFRTRLGLPDWGSNPFVMADISAEDSMLLLTYAMPLEMIGTMLTEWGLTPPQMIAESYFNENVDRWVSWWDENAPRMTDEQKTALWRLLDPQPYEIVEVPLEGRR